MCGMGEFFSKLCSLEIISVGGLPPVAVRRGRSVSEVEMVGTTGFEPATSRTPSVRATRLRYVPTGKLTTIRQEIERTESQQHLHQQGYHRRSSSVKKARSVSRKSRTILRLKSCPAPPAA